MEEIKFFGLNRQELNKALSTVNMTRFQNCPIQVPYAYIFSVPEAKKLEPTSFPFPILVKITKPDQLFAVPKLVTQFPALKDLVETCEETESIVVSRPATLHSSYSNCFFYLSTDYLAVQEILDPLTSRVTLINTNVTSLFEKSGLNPDLVYRIVNTTAGWLVENVLTKDDSRLGFLTNQYSYQSLSDPALHAKFLSGYRTGFFDLKFFNWDLYHQAGKHYVTNPYQFGFEVGKNVRRLLIVELMRLGQKNPNGMICKNLVLAMRILGTQDDSVLMKLTNIHNLFQDSTPETIEEALKAYLNGTGKSFVSWNMLLQNFSTLVESLRYPKYPISDPMRFETPKGDEDIKTNLEFSANSMQVRVSSHEEGSDGDAEDEMVSVRIQMLGWKFRQVAIVNGTEEIPIIDLNSGMGKEEFDIFLNKDQIGPIMDYVKAFKELKHNLKSNAGTEKMYTPAVVKDNNFVHPDTGFVFFSMDLFRDSLVKRHGSTVSFDQVNKYLSKEPGSSVQEIFAASTPAANTVKPNPWKAIPNQTLKDTINKAYDSLIKEEDAKVMKFLNEQTASTASFNSYWEKLMDAKNNYFYTVYGKGKLNKQQTEPSAETISTAASIASNSETAGTVSSNPVLDQGVKDFVKEFVALGKDLKKDPYEVHFIHDEVDEDDFNEDF